MMMHEDTTKENGEEKKPQQVDNAGDGESGQHRSEASDGGATNAQKLAMIQGLAELPEVEYGFRRPDAAKKVGLPLKMLDAEVRRLRKGRARERVGSKHSNSRMESAQPLGGEGVGDCSDECSNPAPIRTAQELYASAREFIEAPDLLSEVSAAISDSGYAGDAAIPLLAYVVISSRLQNSPMKFQVVGPSAAGKNYAVDAAAALIPEDAVVRMTASTPKALIYSDVDLKHKTIILSECDSIANLEGNAATLVRSIIDDDQTTFDTVEKDPETGQNVTRRVTKEGPTGLITTGVRELGGELGTRVLAGHLSDSAEQTKKILEVEAKIAEGHGPELAPDIRARFHDFQRWLQVQATHEAVIPFAPTLATMVPTDEVRMRRDFKQLLALVKAIALLNRRNREQRDDGVILATLADYGWARRLILSSFKSLTAGGITDAVRETCLKVPEDAEVSEADLVRELKVSKSTIHYRVRRALSGGWLVNLENRRGYPYRLVRGQDLQEDRAPLPTVDGLREAFAADQLRKAFEHPAHTNGYSNSPEGIEGVGRNERPFECSNGNHTSDGGRVCAGPGLERNGADPSAGMPSMIVDLLNSCLRYLRYSDEEIEHMTPEKAHEILFAELRDRGYGDDEINHMSADEKWKAIFAPTFGLSDEDEDQAPEDQKEEDS
jgi:hypothetical protein